MSRRQINKALDDLVAHGFVTRWERHPNLRYWRIIHGDERLGVPEQPGAWYSQVQISAWIDGARSMGAAI